MTTTQHERGSNGAMSLSPRVPAAGRTGQGTVIEQSRAVAEVHAMIVVAQQCPRNIPQAIADMRESCRRKELADRAFFRYPQGGQVITGPSIQLARELARVWGNFDYGLKELRRDDEYGQSEILAFAWDLQTNSRNSSLVINPHRQYAGGKDLSNDLRAIYENNANVGARRVREAILAVLPAWFVEEAKDLCNKTISDGGGVPLQQRIANAIEVFGNLGITVPQMEAKLGQKSAKWTDQDVAQLRVIRSSLLRGEISKDEEFPPERVTAAEVIAQQAVVAAAQQEPPSADAEGGEPVRGPAPKGGSNGAAELVRVIAQVPLGTAEDIGEFLSWRAGRKVAGLAALAAGEVTAISAYLGDALKNAGGDSAAAAEKIWDAYKADLAARDQS